MILIPNFKYAFKTGLLVVSAEASGNIYCLLGAHRGLWEAVIEDANKQSGLIECAGGGYAFER